VVLCVRVLCDLCLCYMIGGYRGKIRDAGIRVGNVPSYIAAVEIIIIISCLLWLICAHTWII
jgi:hypothetical protein